MYTVYLDYRKWTIGFYDVVGFSQQIMVRLLTPLESYIAPSN